MVKIDFENTYEPENISEDLSFMTFYSESKTNKILLKAEIVSLEEPLLPKAKYLI